MPGKFDQKTQKLAEKFKNQMMRGQQEIYINAEQSNSDIDQNNDVDQNDYDQNNEEWDDAENQDQLEEENQDEEQQEDEEDDQQEYDEDDEDDQQLDQQEEDQEQEMEYVEVEEQEEDEEEPPKEELMKIAEGDIELMRMRISEILHHLKNKKKMQKTRQEYLAELQEIFCSYYGYTKDLIKVFLQMFAPNELFEFLEANEKQRPTTIRINTLKTRRKELAQVLIQRGVNLDSVAEWTKVGLNIFESKVPIGATPEYLAGHYMIQSASSFLPVMALSPQMNEKILDMAAAPGGKTTYIAQLMKNSGVLFANDSSKVRAKALFFNIQRMGVTNTVITHFDGRKFPKMLFDRVLLDAPCTGLGIIARDPSIKGSKLLKDIQIASHLQKELLLKAIDLTKKGGIIVYSTCSVTIHENEWVIDYALRNRFVKLVECNIQVGEPGYCRFLDKRFDPSMKLTSIFQRIMPHIHNMDGFFVAKLKKVSDGPKKKTEVVQTGVETKVMTKKDKRRERQLANIERKKQRSEREEVVNEVKEGNRKKQKSQ